MFIDILQYLCYIYSILYKIVKFRVNFTIFYPDSGFKIFSSRYILYLILKIL